MSAVVLRTVRAIEMICYALDLQVLRMEEIWIPDMALQVIRATDVDMLLQGVRATDVDMLWFSKL